MQSPNTPMSPHAGENSLQSPFLAGNHPMRHEPDNTKYFFQERYASLNVKGNFLTLCACPKNVELGEWLAHQGLFCSPPRSQSPSPSFILFSLSAFN